MKKLLFLFCLTALSFAVHAQTAVIVKLDARGSSVTGGDNTGKIVSAVWAGQNLPSPAPFVDSTGKTGTNQGLLTWVAINQVGTYNFQLTITDNRGTVTQGTMQVIAKQGQKTLIIFVQPIITIYLPTSFNETLYYNIPYFNLKQLYPA